MTAIKKKSGQQQRMQCKQGTKDLFMATLAKQQQSGLLMFNLSQEVGQQQIVVMPPLVLGQASPACAQSNAASTTSQQYPVDTITSITPCLLLYSVSRAGKTKEVAKAQVHPVRGLFEGTPIPVLYACVQVEELLKSSYENNEIDIPTANGTSCVGVPYHRLVNLYARHWPGW